jgi:dolichol-phosphate mannosyltransferase
VQFVIPAYNEVENVPGLLADLAPRVRELGARVILVDDGSTDGTWEAVTAHAECLPLTVVRHERNRGMGAALGSGLSAALNRASPDEPIVTLEADNTSDLDDLPRLLARYDDGFDVVLASVHAPGGALLGVDPWRRVASRMASNALRLLAGLGDIHTVSSLYRVYRTRALRSAIGCNGSPLVRERGFAASVELLLRLHEAGARIAEVPTVNDWSRRQGRSKLRPGPTAIAYLRLIAVHTVSRISR